jgi:hypothetical protein
MLLALRRRWKRRYGASFGDADSSSSGLAVSNAAFVDGARFGLGATGRSGLQHSLRRRRGRL